MTTLNSVKWINPRDLKEDIDLLETLTDDYINRNLGSIQFIMYTKTMITRITRITKDVARVADLRMLEYQLDRLLSRARVDRVQSRDRVLEDNERTRLKVRNIADDVIEHMYKEYVKL